MTTTYDRMRDAADEAWLPMPSFPDLYEVSSLGNVRSVAKRHRNLSLRTINHRGCVWISLRVGGQTKKRFVHREVAAAFLGGFGDEVNHINGDTQDNRIENLEWCSREANERHSRYVLGNHVYAVAAIDIDTGATVLFPSIREAARYGFDLRHIQGCLSGTKKTHKGKVWARINSEHIKFYADRIRGEGK